MRMFHRRIGHAVTPPDRLPVGGWADAGGDRLLERRDRLVIASHLAAIRLNPNTASSLNQRSVLRVDGGRGERAVRIELGKLSFERFDTDWCLELVDDQHPDGAGLTTTESRGRRVEGNEAVRLQMHERLGEVLATGPSLTTLPGPPRSRDLVRVSVLPVDAFAKIRSPFSSDYVLAPPPSFGPGALIIFPDVGIVELRNLVDQLGLPVVKGVDGRADMIDLSGGRADNIKFLIISTPDGSGLQVEFVEEVMSAIALHRALRSALRVLVDLASLDRPHGVIRAKSLEVVEMWNRTSAAGLDLDSLTPIWTTRRSTDAVHLPLCAPLPVAVVCTAADVDLSATLLAAERWLTVRQRASANDPLDRAARSVPRRYFTRRVVTHSKARRPGPPALRYGYASTSDLTALPHVQKPDWFWSVQLRSTYLADGRRRSTLMVDGLSSSHGVLGYATELFTLFDAFTTLVGHRLPDAEFDTVYLADDAVR